MYSCIRVDNLTFSPFLVMFNVVPERRIDLKIDCKKNLN